MQDRVKDKTLPAIRVSEKMSYYRTLNLLKEPFSTSPDPAFFYQSTHHRAALANILIELRLKRGLNVVLGDIGTGKTTLGRKLIQMMKEREGFLFHIILNPFYPTEELFFDALCRRLGIQLQSAAPTIVDYSEALERFLFQKAVEEKQTVTLIIDEAHKLTPSSLEALRILLNYETNDTKLLQLILLGQIELLPLIESMPNLNDRVSLRCMIKPISLVETEEMIEFRLNEAGYADGTLFTKEAVAEIYRITGGYPRRISLLCHKALRMLVMTKGTLVDEDLINKVIDQEKEGGWAPIRTLQKNVYCA